MTITFEIPHDIERDISADGTDLNDEAREAFLVDLYRRHRISQHQLGTALGIDDYETDEILKRHGVVLEIGIEEQRAEADSWMRDPSAPGSVRPWAKHRSVSDGCSPASRQAGPSSGSPSS